MIIVVAVLLGLLVLVPIFRPRLGLFLLVLVLPVGPEIQVGAVGGFGERVAYSTIVRNEQPVAVSLYDVVLVGLWIGVIIRVAVGKGRLRLWTGTGKLLALWVLMIWISIIAFNRDLTGAQFKITFLYGLKFTEVVSLYFLSLSLLRREDGPRYLSLLQGAAMLAGLMGFLVLAGGMWSAFGIGFVQDRINYFGFFLIALPVAAVHLLARRFRGERPPTNRLQIVALVLMSAILLVVNGKRTLVIGLAAAAASIVWVTRRFTIAALAGLVFLALFAVSPFAEIGLSLVRSVVVGESAGLLSDPQGAMFEETTDMLSGLPLGHIRLDYSWAARAQRALTAIVHFIHEPTVLGFGFWSSIYEMGFDPHNFYLRVLLEQGVGGLFLFILLIRSVFKTARRSCLRATSSVEYRLSVGLTVATVGFLTMSMMADVFYSFQLMGSYWILVAIVNVFADRPLPVAPEALEPSLAMASVPGTLS